MTIPRTANRRSPPVYDPNGPKKKPRRRRANGVDVADAELADTDVSLTDAGAASNVIPLRRR